MSGRARGENISTQIDELPKKLPPAADLRGSVGPPIWQHLDNTKNPIRIPDISRFDSKTVDSPIRYSDISRFRKKRSEIMECSSKYMHLVLIQYLVHRIFFGYRWRKSIAYFQSCRDPESSDIRKSLIQDIGGGPTLRPT